MYNKKLKILNFLKSLFHRLCFLIVLNSRAHRLKSDRCLLAIWSYTRKHYVQNISSSVWELQTFIYIFFFFIWAGNKEYTHLKQSHKVFFQTLAWALFFCFKSSHAPQISHFKYCLFFCLIRNFWATPCWNLRVTTVWTSTALSLSLTRYKEKSINIWFESEV